MSHLQKQQSRGFHKIAFLENLHTFTVQRYFDRVCFKMDNTVDQAITVDKIFGKKYKKFRQGRQGMSPPCFEIIPIFANLVIS